MDMVITTVKNAAPEQFCTAGRPFNCTLEITLETAGISIVDASAPKAFKAALNEVMQKLLGMQVALDDSVLLSASSAGIVVS